MSPPNNLAKPGRRRWPSFRQRWLKHSAPLFLITTAVLILEQSSCLAPVESIGIDRLVRSYPRPISNEISIVEITDADYEAAFCGKSPLDGAILEELLTAVAKANPAVVGVDLDTSHTLLPSLKEDSRFIWAEVPVTVEPETRNKSFPFLLAPVVGDLRKPDRMGMPQFPQEQDGVVRRFKDSFELVDGPKLIRIPSLACAVVRATHPDVECLSGQERRLSVSGDRFQFKTLDAQEVLSWRHREKGHAPSLEHQIVLVGGRYRAARDTYVTAAGELAGVELIANAAQSFLQDGGFILDAKWYVNGLFDLCAGSLLIWAFWYWEQKLLIAFWFSIVVAPLVVMIVSWLSFVVTRHWLPFIPVMLGMLIHELHDYGERLGESPENIETKTGFEFLETIVSYRSRRQVQYRPPDRSEP